VLAFVSVFAVTGAGALLVSLQAERPRKLTVSGIKARRIITDLQGLSLIMECCVC
jgi:hypothetical protein